MLKGEIRCQSLLRVKGLSRHPIIFPLTSANLLALLDVICIWGQLNDVCVYHELLWATPNNYYIFAIHSMAFLQTKADNSRWGPPSTACTLWVFAIELQRFATKFCEVYKCEMKVFKPAHASSAFSGDVRTKSMLWLYHCVVGLEGNFLDTVSRFFLAQIVFPFSPSPIWVCIHSTHWFVNVVMTGDRR